MRLIDSHCHLDFPDFAAERDEVVARAGAAGVARMITISTRVDRFEAYRAIAETYPNVWFTIGTHPHQAGEEPEVPVERLVALAAHPRCVGIGEAGLDYHYDKTPRDASPSACSARISPPRAKDGSAARHPLARRRRGHGAHPA